MNAWQAATEHRKAAALALGAALLWSLGGYLIKSVAWHPLAISGTRSAIAALVLLALLRPARLDLSPTVLAGGLAYAGTVILFVLATKLTTAANAILLQYTAPIYAALLGAWFLGERTTWADWLTIAAVIAGIALFFLDRLTLGGLWGNLAALASGVTYASLIVLLRKQKNASPIQSVILGNILTALIGLPFALGSAPGGAGWPAIVALGVFQLGLSYWIYSEAIKHLSALQGVLIPVIEPILNPVWVLLLTGEMPGRWAILGGGMVLAAITVRYAAGPLRARRALPSE